MKLLERLGLVQKTDSSEDRKAFVLNVLLLSTITLISAGLIIHLIGDILQALHLISLPEGGIPLLEVIIVVAFFTILYNLSLRGYSRLASYIFISCLLLLAAFMGIRWGVDVTVSILFYVLCVIISGVLLGSRQALVILGMIVTIMIVLGHLQALELISPNQYWRAQSWSFSDTIMTGFILCIIAGVSTLATRQTEHALQRATTSEAELKKERDQLEETIERRTKELRQLQMERFANMYRFAEFGRLSSGLFHNLANLLTGSTLNMDRLMESPAWDVGGMKANIKSALRAHNKMRRFIETTHRQLAGEQEMSTFSALSEVSEIIQLVSHRARSAAVSIVIEAEEDVSLYGSPVIFNQIVISLITNAIDAYFDVPTTARDNRKVIVCIRDLGSHVSLEVVDKGCGVPEDIREKIFEPFFTTKSDSRGVGIGLALTKRMVERDFGGTISVTCNKENGTVFTIIFPKKQADAASLA